MKVHNIRFHCEIRKIMYYPEYPLLSEALVMCLKDADGMANNVDPDKTAPEQSDQGFHCLFRPTHTNI